MFELEKITMNWLKDGNDINQHIFDGKNILHLIIETHDPDLKLLKFILKYEIDINYPDY